MVAAASLTLPDETFAALPALLPPMSPFDSEEVGLDPPKLGTLPVLTLGNFVLLVGSFGVLIGVVVVG